MQNRKSLRHFQVLWAWVGENMEPQTYLRRGDILFGDALYQRRFLDPQLTTH